MYANGIAGLDTNFSWQSFAASVAGSYVGQAAGHVSGKLPDAVSRSISGFAAGASSAILSNQDDINYAQIAVNAFASAVGNSITDKLASRESAVVTQKKDLAGTITTSAPVAVEGVNQQTAIAAKAESQGATTSAVVEQVQATQSSGEQKVTEGEKAAVASASKALDSLPDQTLSAGLAAQLRNNGYTIAEVMAVDSSIFTTNADGNLSVKPVIIKDTVNVDPDSVLDQGVLDRMTARIMLNDRANAYLELYNATGNEQLVLQAQITTYSGIIGSFALLGNMLAKDNAGPLYNVSLDEFSLRILGGTRDIAQLYVDKPISELTANILQEADHGVWNSMGMGHLFPGNVQFFDSVYHTNPELAKSIFNSQGTKHALQIGGDALFGYSDELGNRPADFEGKKGFTM